MPVSARQRQFMQPLRSLAWINAADLDAGPNLIAKVLANGWIEKRGAGRDLVCKLTDSGLAALKARVKV
jgi:hypothetical protein